jgi:hypothetical protein
MTNPNALAPRPNAIPADMNPAAVYIGGLRAKRSRD